MLPPHFPRQGLQRLMNFGALSRGFSTCCLRFKNRVATTPARLASGWLARLYREGVEPSGLLQKVSDHISRPPFLDLAWRKGSFIFEPPSSFTSLDHLIGAGKQHLRDHDAESFRRPEIDHEFEFRRRPNGKIRRLRTAKDATGIFRGTPEQVRGVHPIG